MMYCECIKCSSVIPIYRFQGVHGRGKMWKLVPKSPYLEENGDTLWELHHVWEVLGDISWCVSGNMHCEGAC